MTKSRDYLQKVIKTVNLSSTLLAAKEVLYYKQRYSDSNVNENYKTEILANVKE